MLWLRVATDVVSSRNHVVSTCHALVASRNRVVSSRNAVVASRNVVVASRKLSFSYTRDDADMTVQIVHMKSDPDLETTNKVSTNTFPHLTIKPYRSNFAIF